MTRHLRFRWSRRGLIAALAFVLTATPQRPGQAEDDERVRTVGLMGTDVQVTVQGPDAALLEKAVDAAIAEFARVEDVFTTWRDSPFMAVNRGAGVEPVPVSDEIFDLVQRSLEISELTDGAFDITWAGAGKLWNFKDRDHPSIPDEAAIREAVAHVGWGKVRLDEVSRTIFLPEAGMRIDLGGIAKGYGVERAAGIVRDMGIRNAVINAGGDLRAMGRNRGALWKIAIKHPRDRERVLAVLPVSNACVVTSGDYERYFEKDGVRYHHIIDPRTGYPSRGCMSATIVASDATFADALATGVMVLGPEKGLALIERLDGVEGLLVGQDGNVVVSSGLRAGK